MNSRKIRAHTSRTPRLKFAEPLEARVLLSTTYYISPSGSDSAAGTSPTTPFQTIQHAANLVGAGDTVDVLAGTYTQGFSLFWTGQSGTPTAPITFKAEPGAIITGPNAKTADAIDLENSSYITIQGFTINNTSNSISRAGIRAVSSGSPNDEGIVIQNNTVTNPGTWGIFTAFSDDTLIQNNTCSGAQQQHGIYASNSSQRPVIRSNTLFNNHDCGIEVNADVTEGGVGTTTGALIEDNVIYNNGSGGGAGINLGGVNNSRVQNNLLYNNHASGIVLASLNAANGSRNNCVTNNTVVMPRRSRWAIRVSSWSGNAGQHTPSTGNVLYNNILCNPGPSGSLAIDPDCLNGFVSDYNVVRVLSPDAEGSYVDLEGWQRNVGRDTHSITARAEEIFADVARNNYHLKRHCRAAGSGGKIPSPSASPSKDLDQIARPPNGPFDMGAYVAPR